MRPPSCSLFAKASLVAALTSSACAPVEKTAVAPVAAPASSVGLAEEPASAGELGQVPNRLSAPSPLTVAVAVEGSQGERADDERRPSVQAAPRAKSPCVAGSDALLRVRIAGKTNPNRDAFISQQFVRDCPSAVLHRSEDPAYGNDSYPPPLSGYTSAFRIEW